MRFNVGILSVGDEILIGQTVNTNAAYIGKMVSSIGCRVQHSFCCPDDSNVMKEQLDYLIQRNNAVVITGGLGPTHDDITKNVLVEYFNDELYHNDEVLAKIKRYFTDRNRVMRSINNELALVPRKAFFIENNIGTAPGIHYDNKVGNLNCDVFSLPGVPREMRSMLDGYLIDILNSRIQQDYLKQVYYTIETSGIGESDLAEMIGDPEEIIDLTSSLAYLPSTGGVRLRIGTEGTDTEKNHTKIASIAKTLTERVGKYIVSSDEFSKSEVLKKMLIRNGMSISVAESCTGGMLGSYLTELSGSSQFFYGGVIAYSNAIKTTQLGVSVETLDLYGAVSEQTAIEMATGVKEKLNTDIGISITGIAGPSGGSIDKPVGTVWIGMSTPMSNYARKFLFGKHRSANRELSVSSATNMLIEYLKDQN